MNHRKLIEHAASVVKTLKTKDGLFGDVGCALISETGKMYLGVCAAVGSNTFCAEKNAIGSMITDSTYKIEKIVAVWKDGEGRVFVIPPCGNCRQFIKETHADNLNTDVVLDYNKVIKLHELLPYHDWWQKQ